MARDQYSAFFYYQLAQVIAVAAFAKIVYQGSNSLNRDIAHTVGNLLWATHLHALSLFYGFYKGCGLQQGFMGTGIKPCRATPQQLNIERSLLEVAAIKISDFQFAPL